MNPIELKLDDRGDGAFVIESNGERLAEMAMRVSGENMIVTHTEVAEELRGHKVADRLFAEMIDYARKNHLKVVPLCAYVLLQFKRHPEKYDDIWNRNWKQ